MPSFDDLEDEIKIVLGTTWDTRNGQSVPDTSDVALSDGAIKIDATFLYADLAGSKLAQICPWGTTA